MKPEIIFVSEKDGLITLSKEDLITLVDKAYNAGKADASGTITTPYYICKTSPPTKHTEITCHTENAMGETK